MPAKVSPTSLGAAALESGKHEEKSLDELQKFFQENNTKHIQSQPHGPWINGRAERMDKITKDCMLKVLH